ncbi:3-deoxy-8-phosphooctulonate synthase [bacterium]|nr:3-deoxy-8-phosphooctulonate synthase [bacterium]
MRSKDRTVKIGDFSIGSGQRLCLIAGPCVLESTELALTIARTASELAAANRINYIFKASFDKANRTSFGSARGPGLREGLSTLAEIKRQLQIPVLTDVHEVHQVEQTAAVVDVLQIPAFLCRQTDLLLEAGRTGKAVNVKKGQFLSPDLMLHVVEKIRSTGNSNILLTERGTFFGYTDLVVDMRSLLKMRALGQPVIYDAGHSLQQPGAAGSSSGGERQYIPHLARGAVAVGCDGIFLEIHPDPDTSPSDSKTIWPLDRLEHIVKEIVAVHNCCQDFHP